MPADNLPRSELQLRLALLMVNESARCLEEQVVADAATVDFAIVMGTGFAPFPGRASALRRCAWTGAKSSTLNSSG